MFSEDLTVALDKFGARCADPTHSYDQIVRYRHLDGSTVWMRCRGVAIRHAQEAHLERVVELLANTRANFNETTGNCS